MGDAGIDVSVAVGKTIVAVAVSMGGNGVSVAVGGTTVAVGTDVVGDVVSVTDPLDTSEVGVGVKVTSTGKVGSAVDVSTVSVGVAVGMAVGVSVSSDMLIVAFRWFISTVTPPF